MDMFISTLNLPEPSMWVLKSVCVCVCFFFSFLFFLRTLGGEGNSRALLLFYLISTLRRA